MANQVTDNTFEAEVLQCDLPVLVDFWAPWCGVCKVQSPTISNLHRSKGDEINVYGVVVDYGSVEELEAYVEREEIDYPLLLGTWEMAGYFRVNSFPTLYFLDEEATIRRNVIGYTTGLGIRGRLLF